MTELIFYDPLANSVPEQHADGSRVAVISVHASPQSERVERKRLNKKRPATRADAIEAVSRELELLALRRGRQ